MWETITCLENVLKVYVLYITCYPFLFQNKVHIKERRVGNFWEISDVCFTVLGKIHP